MSKSRRSQRSAGRNTNNYEYKKEVSCKDNYLSNKHKEAREEFIKNNPIVPMNPKQRKYMELLEDKNVLLLVVLQERLRHISQQLHSLIGTEQVRLIKLC